MKQPEMLALPSSLRGRITWEFYILTLSPFFPNL